MITQMGLAYGPAFLLFFGAVFLRTVHSRISLAIAILSIVACFLLALQTVTPNPSRGFLNWIPILVPLFGAVGFLPHRIWKWTALAVTVVVASIFVSKIIEVNPRWEAHEQWLNGAFLIVLPLLLIWFSLTRHRESGEFPSFAFGTFGFVTLISIISYLIAWTSKLVLMVGGIGILCAAGFLAGTLKRNRSDLGPVGFLLLGTTWMSTVYVHYFSEKLPVFVTGYLLYVSPLFLLSRLSDRPLVWKIIVPVIVVVLGASATAYIYYLASATDVYGY